MSSTKQTAIKATLPTLKDARTRWEGALAELETFEEEVEKANTELAAMKKERDRAAGEFRRCSALLREVMAEDKQERLA